MVQHEYTEFKAAHKGGQIARYARLDLRKLRLLRPLTTALCVKSGGAMVIEPKAANHFIEGYKSFLLYAGNIEREGSGAELLHQLAQGRDEFLENPPLLEDFRNQHKEIESWVFEAIESIEVTNWVYLRDTTRYSLFIRADQSAAFAVLGLTDRIRDIFGHSGLYLRTGVFPLGNAFVCDGLIASIASLGTGYKKAFNESYREIKKEGRFFKSPRSA